MVPGYANTRCPYCDHPLAPLPASSGACPACGETIYVRAGPDGFVYLLQDIDRRVLDEAWAEHFARLQAEAQAGRRAEAEEAARRTLSNFRSARILTMQIALAPEACPACQAQAGLSYPVRHAPALPISGCTNPVCRCQYVPGTE